MAGVFLCLLAFQYAVCNDDILMSCLYNFLYVFINKPQVLLFFLETESYSASPAIVVEVAVCIDIVQVVVEVVDTPNTEQPSV